MKVKENTLESTEQFRGYGLTFLDNITDEGLELKKEMDFLNLTNEFYPSVRKNIWMSNIKGIELSKYHKPIPLNKIGLLSENFKRMKI